MSQIEKWWLNEVHELPCVLCARIGIQQETKTEAHHTTVDRGKQTRSPDLLSAALCVDCHRGPAGIHGSKHRLHWAKVGELVLVADTVEAILKANGIGVNGPT